MRDNSLQTSFWKTLAAKSHYRQLVVILILAFLLRLSGNQYDAPYRFHPDEKHYLDRAVKMMREGTLNPAYFSNPPLFTYAILLALYGAFGLQYLTGAVGSRAHFLATLPSSVPFEIARGLTALAGTTICVILFLIGKRFGGELAGLLAALFYGVAFLSVKDAHFAVNDIPMTCLVILAFLFAVRFLDGGLRRDLVCGGLTAGLAAATKYTGAIALLPLLLASVVRQWKQKRASGSGKVQEIGVGWLVLLVFGAAGFLLGNPYGAIDIHAFLSDFSSQYGRLVTMQFPSSAPVPLLAFEALVVDLGWPLLLLFPAAAGYCLARGGARSKATMLAASVPLSLILYHSSQALFSARFLLPSTPFIAVICAWGIVAFHQWSQVPWARRPVILWAGIAVLVVSPLSRSVYLDMILRQSDTRILARAYLDRVAPTGSLIVREMDSSYAPPVDSRRYRLSTLKVTPSLAQVAGEPADYYLFNSFDIGRVPGVSEADERSLMVVLERLGFTRIAFSPRRGGGDLQAELEPAFLPYRNLFQYDRPGPMVVIYARPGLPGPSSTIGLPPSRVRSRSSM